MNTQLKVLLVEDDKFSQLIAEVALRNIGVFFKCVQSGEEALDLLSGPEGTSFNFILMDFRMPKMDGFETTRRIRSHLNPDVQKIPIIGLSGNKTFADQREAIAAGMNICISKPVSISALKKVFFDIETSNESTVEVKLEKADAVLDVRTLNYLLEETNISVVRKVVQSFLKNLPFYVDQISQGLAQGRDDLIHRYSHILKASSGTVGATSLFALSSELEMISSEAEHANLGELVKKVREGSELVVLALTSYLDEIWVLAKEKPLSKGKEV